jgi:hypothetical protein
LREWDLKNFKQIDSYSARPADLIKTSGSETVLPVLFVDFVAMAQLLHLYGCS